MELVIQNICFFIAELIKLGLFMIGLLDYKPKRRYKSFLFGTIISMIIITLMNIIITTFPTLNAKGLDYLLNFLVIITVVFSISGKSKMLVTLIVYTGVSLIDVIFIGAIQIFTKITIIKEDLTYIAINSISIFVIFLFIILKIKLKSNLNISHLQFRKRYLFIVFFGMIGCGFYVGLIQNFGLGLDFSDYDSYFSLGVYASGIAFIIICVSLLILNDSNAQYKSINDMNQKLLDQQRLYYQTLIDKEQYTKRFRHDINNHIYCMQHLCDQKKYNELANYLFDMQKFTTELNLDVQTGNNIVNIIINELYSKNKDENISIIWRGLLPERLKISSMDLCTIFSNLFINAIEAVKNIENNDKRIIEVSIRTLCTNIVIQINNPVKEKINIINNKLLTTKLNKDQHGLGSLNIEKCAKKYNADLQYNCTENLFTVNIVFPNIIL